MEISAANNDHSLSLIFKLQCALIVIIFGGSLLVNFQNTLDQFGSLTSVMIITLVPLIGILTPNVGQPAVQLPLLQKAIKNTIRLVITTLYPFVLFFGICLLFLPLVTQAHISKMPIIYLAFLLGAGGLIPYLKLFLINETGAVTRMIFIFAYLFFSPYILNQLGILGFNTSYSFGIWITFNSTSLLTILSYLFLFITTGYVMHRWGFSLPRLKINSTVNYGWLSLIVALVLLELNSSAGSWHNVFYHFDWQLVSGPLAYFIMTIVTVCCYEEIIFRYSFFWQLLHFKHTSPRTQQFWAILISSLLFGLWHAQNIFDQSLPATLLQMVSAIGTGFILATISLYTGTIWIAIILHSLTDLAGAPEVTSAFSQTPSAFEIEYMLLAALLEIGVSLILLLGKKRQAAFKQTMARIRI
ncbi:MAG: CPBP family intramembrane metalloprotease [Lentilactobacillus diolivorans]|jgi:membrane protease YdiL (CAAX protease family)|nr:CPBP family intramembrane metalloprotease [Lentilactobacillus diolivorans]RRG01985.1 MAG: CPBP family intramembrane metalloprotease [Lactobacillus sp.]